MPKILILIIRYKLIKKHRKIIFKIILMKINLIMNKVLKNNFKMLKIII